MAGLMSEVQELLSQRERGTTASRRDGAAAGGQKVAPNGMPDQGATSTSTGRTTQPLLLYTPYTSQFEQHKGMADQQDCTTSHSGSNSSMRPTQTQEAVGGAMTSSNGHTCDSSNKQTNSSSTSSSSSSSTRPRVPTVTFEGIDPPREPPVSSPNNAIAAPATQSSSSRGPTAASAAVARRQQQALAAAASSQESGDAAAGASKGPAFSGKARTAGAPLFGPGHVHGMLQHPLDDAHVTNLPFKTGTAFRLRPARMRPSSCVPPPFVEPLEPLGADTRAAMELHDAKRLESIGSVMNRLVYDSLEQPSGVGSSGCSNGTDSRRRTEDITPGSCAPCCDYYQDLPAWLPVESSQDTTLVFESRFECGNLRRAVQVYEYEYDLILQPDLNTRAHTQWFYFAVANTRAGVPYKFNIINLMKDDSLYNNGMLPLVHSEKDLEATGVGWRRTGKHVCYYPNSLRRRKQRYHTLTFTLTFAHDRDLVHIAHCYPYGYSDLQRALWAAQQQQSSQQQDAGAGSSIAGAACMSRATLCRTLAHNVCDVLTITAPAGCGVPLEERRGIVLSARVHPGETNASWMMKGALEFLLGDTADAQRLRETFVFKVVPMLNPDGVITGNYRCSLAGLDLNRVWQEPDEKVQPTIRAFKAMLKSFLAERPVALFCDLHGHSRKFGIFIYGCEKRPRDAAPAAPGWPAPGSVGGLDIIPARHQDKVFPLLLHLATPDLFSFRSCNFKVQKSKAGTGRVVGWRELGLVNAFTMEASFCGASTGQYARCHFNTGHLEQMGASLCHTLLDYWEPSSSDAIPELLSQLEAVQGMKASQMPADWAGSELLMEDNDDTCTDSDDESSEEEEDKSSNNNPAAVNSSGREGRSSGAGSNAAAAASAAAALASGAPLSSLSTGSAVALLSGMSAKSAVALLRSSTGGEGLQASLQPLLSGNIDWQAVANAAASAAATGGGNWQAAAAATAAAVAVASAGRSNGTAGSRNASSGGAGTSSSTADCAASRGPASQAALPSYLDGVKRTRSAGSLASMMQASAPLPTRTSRDRSHLLDTWPKHSATSDPGSPPGTIDGRQNQAQQQATGTSSSGTSQDMLSLLPMDMLVMTPDGTRVPLVALLLAGMATTPDTDAAAFAANAAATAAAAAAAGSGSSIKVKKGRRKGLARYGNPEFLRAERAKADAGLAATLPLLAERNLWSAGAAAPGTSSTSSSAKSPEAVYRGPAADDSNSHGSQSAYFLDLERYEGLLVKQRRQVGGVLASSHDSAAAGSLDHNQGMPSAAAASPEPGGLPRRRSKSADSRQVLRAVGPGIISRSPVLQSAHH